MLTIAKSEITQLTKKKREEIILEWWGIDESDAEFLNLPEKLQTEILEFDEPIDDIMDPKYIPLLVEVLLFSYYGVKNSYLSKKCSKITGMDIEVTGKVEGLELCPCCGYRTIKKRGYYEICPVCYWEDDGIDNINRYSSPNHMSIHDYRLTKMKLDEEMKERYISQ